MTDLEKRANNLAKEICNLEEAFHSAIIEGRDPTKLEEKFTELNQELSSICVLISKSNKENL